MVQGDNGGRYPRSPQILQRRLRERQPILRADPPINVSTLQHIPGTFDVLPDPTGSPGAFQAPAAAWRHVEGVVRELAARYGFEEIRTPVLEPTDLIARGAGATSDIVTKEMFAFEKGDTAYVLRPEVTAPVMRAYLEHRLDQRGGTQKLFYIGPCFRAERPQKGRYRQFHQFGTETLGASDPRADAECIAFMVAVYRTLGITNTRLRLNNLGDAEDRRAYRNALRAFLAPHAAELSETSRQRLETNPLRILDTKLDHERRLLEGAPLLPDYVGAEARAHFDEVKRLLSALDVAFEEDPALVRGLDYYNRTAFELESPDLGAQSALGGGGRYDGLAQAIGAAQPVPAVGFAAGLERLFLALDATGATLPAAPRPDVFLVALGDGMAARVFLLAERLRAEGLHATYDLRGASMKAQMREANRQGAPLVLIVAKDEDEAGVVGVKDMASGVQENVAHASLLDALHARLSS